MNRHVIRLGRILGGNVMNGLWIAFIGWFLESAAASQVGNQVDQA
jgi:hypothetical protein